MRSSRKPPVSSGEGSTMTDMRLISDDPRSAANFSKQPLIWADGWRKVRLNVQPLYRGHQCL